MTRSRGILAPRRPWTRKDDALVRARYPHQSTAILAAALGRTISAVSQRAYFRFKLKKTSAYLASPAACRLRRGDHVGAACRFRKGNVPHNKGLRRPGWFRGRMRETQFKPGVRTGIAAKNWRPIGTILTDTEGYQRIKVREAKKGEAYGFGNVHVWPLLNRHLWEQAHGPIPPGHTVVFKDGDKSHCVLANLELITRAALMKRNTIHNLPKPLAQTIQLLGAINRQLKKRTHGEAHDR